MIQPFEKILKKCIMGNGAIIASYDSRDETKDYRYVWPRDGAFACITGNKLGINNFQENFFTWCMKTEKWNKTGLLYKKYKTNGTRARITFQPDNTALVLIAAHHHYNNRDIPKKIIRFLTKTSDALCDFWHKDNFTITHEDVWEERKGFSDLKQTITYSVASCSKALELMFNLLNNKKYLTISKQMRKVIKNDNGVFIRKNGLIKDTRMDASLLGLVWPLEIISRKDFSKTLSKIKKDIVKNNGVYRYEHDEYDGWMKGVAQRKQGAGYWPLLNFWMAIVSKDKKYFNKVLKDTKNGLIPEQIFNNKYQKSVTPLLWSHCMYELCKIELQ